MFIADSGDLPACVWRRGQRFGQGSDCRQGDPRVGAAGRLACCHRRRAGDRLPVDVDFKHIANAALRQVCSRAADRVGPDGKPFGRCRSNRVVHLILAGVGHGIHGFLRSHCRGRRKLFRSFRRGRKCRSSGVLHRSCHTKWRRPSRAPARAVSGPATGPRPRRCRDWPSEIRRPGSR